MGFWDNLGRDINMHLEMSHQRKMFFLEQMVQLIEQARLKADLKEYGQALAAYEQAYALGKGTGSTDLSNMVLREMAHIYKEHEQYDKALALLDIALTTATKNKDDRASTLNRMGIVYEASGDTQKALAYYEAGLKLRLGRKERETHYWLSRNAGVVC